MSNGIPKPPGFRLTTASWVAIVVGVIMLGAGVIFDISAASMVRETQSVTTQLPELLRATTMNTSNIANLAASVDHLRALIEGHVIGVTR